MRRDAKAKTRRSELTRLSEGFQIGEQRTVHITAAAAVKAAATALLTNQVVRKVQFSLLDGRTVSFKVEKCIIDQDSALCLIAGHSETGSKDSVPEVCVRVAWEEVLPLQPRLSEDEPSPNPSFDLEPELLWLHLDTPDQARSVETESDGASFNTTEVSGPAPISRIPLFLRFGSEEDNTLRETPRELLSAAVREALGSYPTAKLIQGVQVFVSLSGNDLEKVGGLPRLQAIAEVAPPLFDKPPVELTRLMLALDTYGQATLPLLTEEENELIVELSSRKLNLKNALEQIGLINGLTTLTVGGGPSTVIALAAGDLTSLDFERLDNVFLVSLAQRRDLDSATIQDLRDIRRASELINLLNRRRLGWFFDEICRLASAEIRKRLPRALRLELIIVGSSGAVLGRALTEPASFRL